MPDISELIGDSVNFVFVGEAGGGKSEIAINFAKWLLERGDKPVAFFDMDMTKPLFRSRDVCEQMQEMGIDFHYEVQFMDSPVVVGGVNQMLKDENTYTIFDVGGDHIGARSMGGFAQNINADRTIVYYILNYYRPWSYDIEHIDATLGKILGVSHIDIHKLHMVNNPNNGLTTTAEEFLTGCERMHEIMDPYAVIDYACVHEDIYEEVRDSGREPVFPIHLYLTYPWLNADLGPDGMPMPRRRGRPG